MSNATAHAHNHAIAALLREIATLYEAQGASSLRFGHYRRAAALLEGLEEDIELIAARSGPEGLDELPGIGLGLAAVIDEIARTGHAAVLDKLRGDSDPEPLLRTVPGVGPELARRIHEELHISSLEDFQCAAHDGRLAGLAGLGERRRASLAANLAQILESRRRERPTRPAAEEPPVSVFMEVDRLYREGAANGTLPTITPRQQNPRRLAWLPVLHVDEGDTHLTAMFSNTERAHQLGRTRDWVVIYFSDSSHHQHQRTVVTETRGPLAGQRVVRGREDECRPRTLA